MFFIGEKGRLSVVGASLRLIFLQGLASGHFSSLRGSGTTVITRLLLLGSVWKTTEFALLDSARRDVEPCPFQLNTTRD